VRRISAVLFILCMSGCDGFSEARMRKKADWAKDCDAGETYWMSVYEVRACISRSLAKRKDGEK
jgi:hypothetical protein